MLAGPLPQESQFQSKLLPLLLDRVPRRPAWLQAACRARSLAPRPSWAGGSGGLP